MSSCVPTRTLGCRVSADRRPAPAVTRAPAVRHGTGGIGATGGLTGTGGRPTGGVTGTGGRATGGVTGTGGTATGGIKGTGGKATGGVTGAAGARGTGGITGTAGARATGGIKGTGGRGTGGVTGAAGEEAPAVSRDRRKRTGGTTGAAGSTGTGPCAGLCDSPTTFTRQSYSSGNVGTGAACFETTASIQGGNCSSVTAPRTFSVNGKVETVVAKIGRRCQRRSTAATVFNSPPVAPTTPPLRRSSG